MILLPSSLRKWQQSRELHSPATTSTLLPASVAIYLTLSPSHSSMKTNLSICHWIPAHTPTKRHCSRNFLSIWSLSSTFKLVFSYIFKKLSLLQFPSSYSPFSHLLYGKTLWKALSQQSCLSAHLTQSIFNMGHNHCLIFETLFFSHSLLVWFSSYFSGHSSLSTLDVSLHLCMGLLRLSPGTLCLLWAEPIFWL